MFLLLKICTTYIRICFLTYVPVHSFSHFLLNCVIKIRSQTIRIFYYVALDLAHKRTHIPTTSFLYMEHNVRTRTYMRSFF